MAHGTHDFEDDARNECILVWVNGELVPRERACGSEKRLSCRESSKCPHLVTGCLPVVIEAGAVSVNP